MARTITETMAAFRPAAMPLEVMIPSILRDRLLDPETFKGAVDALQATGLQDVSAGETQGGADEQAAPDISGERTVEREDDAETIERLLGKQASPNAARSSQHVLESLRAEIHRIEEQLKAVLESNQQYQILQTMGGVGEVLSMTIWLETGDLGRFPQVGHYASYCRCVGSEKTSNQKKKGEGNRKNGNQYLAWAWQEAAAGAIRWQAAARSFYQSKKAKKGAWVAHKALAHKLCRAGYFMLRDQVAYSSARLFG